jgi:hypothetical protein
LNDDSICLLSRSEWLGTSGTAKVSTEQNQFSLFRQCCETSNACFFSCNCCSWWFLRYTTDLSRGSHDVWKVSSLHKTQAWKNQAGHEIEKVHRQCASACSALLFPPFSFFFSSLFVHTFFLFFFNFIHNANAQNLLLFLNWIGLENAFGRAFGSTSGGKSGTFGSGRTKSE